MSDGTLKATTEFGEEQFSREDLEKRRTVIHPDGSGDILFFIEKPIPYDLDPLFSWRGAKGIEDVISAENAIKSALQNL